MAHLHDHKCTAAATLQCFGESPSFRCFMWGCMNHNCLSLRGKKRLSFKRIGDKCELRTYRQKYFICCSLKQYSMLMLLHFLKVFVSLFGCFWGNIVHSIPPPPQKNQNKTASGLEESAKAHVWYKERLCCSLSIRVWVNLAVYS